MLQKPVNNGWQGYTAGALFTLRCRLCDNDGVSQRLCDCIGRAGGRVGGVVFVKRLEDYIVQDFTVSVSDKNELERLLDSIKQFKEMKEVISVRDEILEIHRRGSIEMVSRVPLKSISDLRMVYTPGVAQVCRRVEDERDSAWEWTGICDRVAIVTNGTAVLGLGDIGPLPSLPVMEGKAAIFAEFAGISGVPILVDSQDVRTFIETVVRISDGFGAIQLEDVSAPSCFEIEQGLTERLDKPVFHDDQHGTATVVLAAIIRALEITGKKASDCSVVIAGAGAAGYAVSFALHKYGLGDIVVYDSAGAIYRGRDEKMNAFKTQLSEITNRDNISGPLSGGFEGKDIFIGVSRPNLVGKEAISSMANGAIVLPLSNPVGEISKEEALEAGARIAADGRDINNALAYPGIFRGALDARAKRITFEMKLAAAKKLAELACGDELLPDMVDKAVHRQVADAVAKSWHS